MPVPAERGRHKRSLLRVSAYESIRDAIVDGTFAPGEQLRDTQLEQWLGISRTPIREAIARLETAGLVYTDPGRSTVVSTIERKAVLDTQSVTAAMHSLAARIAVPLMRADNFEAMEIANANFARALDDNDVDGALQSDSDFHEVAVAVSENDVIRSVLEQITPVLRRVERLRFASLSGRESIAQHAEIIALCRRGDADGAAEATRRNWETLGLFTDQPPQA